MNAYWLSPWLTSVAAPPSRGRFELADTFQIVGPTIRIDASKRTAVLGVYAAGDLTRDPHSVTWAAADGVTAGVSLRQLSVFRSLAA
jgi:thioredoxin reductase